LNNGKLTKFVLNKAGVRELLQSEAMQEVLSEFAQAKAQEAGEGYTGEVHVGKNRAYANIYAETEEAKVDNLENNTLEKVIRT